MALRIFIFLLVFVFAGCSTLFIDKRPTPCKSKRTLRFATYNLFCENGHHQDLNGVTCLIYEINPDIMVFQECQCFSEKYYRCQLRQRYPYHLSFHYSDSIKEHDDGLAIISKYPIINNLFLPPVYGWSPGWLVTIKTPKGCLQVFNVHLNPKLVCENNIGLFGEGIWATSQFRLKEINYYYQFLNPKLPTIIAGDFNENDNCAVANYLCNRNFFDNLTLVPAYIKTWYWNAAGFVVTGRYDRIYNSPCLHTKYCRVVTKGDSDHFPVFVDYCY